MATFHTEVHKGKSYRRQAGCGDSIRSRCQTLDDVHAMQRLGGVAALIGRRRYLWLELRACPSAHALCASTDIYGVLYQCTHAVMPGCVAVSVPSACVGTFVLIDNFS
eukprot:155892-Chlamydomonas_euryale.AAC.1